MAVTETHKAKSNKPKKYYRRRCVEIFLVFARFVDFCEVPGAERENDKTKHYFEVEKQNWLENVAKMFAHEYLCNKQTFATFQQFSFSAINNEIGLLGAISWFNCP